MHQRACKECGTPFLARLKIVVYCSEPCSRASKARAAAPVASTVATPSAEDVAPSQTASRRSAPASVEAPSLPVDTRPRYAARDRAHFRYLRRQFDRIAERLHDPLPIIAGAGLPPERAEHTVYGLIDVRSPGRILYVGRTDDPKRRFDNHLRTSYHILSVIPAEHLAMVELERAPWDEIKDRERIWMLAIRRAGGAGLNTSGEWHLLERFEEFEAYHSLTP